MSTTRRKWSREETILAFDLYCRTPFGKIHTHNPSIQELARLIGREASALVFKMMNLAHHDPSQRRRNVSGLSHSSRLDGEVFREFAEDWEELSYQAQRILADISGTTVEERLDLTDVERLPPGECRERLRKERVGQIFFRDAVLNAYGGKCCITGIDNREMLIASHIKPWRVADARTERTNPGNGLCLNPLHDKAFDRGLITLDMTYHVVISPRLRDTNMDAATREWLLSYSGREIALPERFCPKSTFIEYHNDFVFKT